MMAAKTDLKPIEEVPPVAEKIWLDMTTREIVRESGDTVCRYMPGETEFALYAEMNTYEKRNDRKPVA
jgi:hypothetical protein